MRKDYKQIWSVLYKGRSLTYSDISLRLSFNFGIRMSEAAISARLREMARLGMCEGQRYKNKTNNSSHKRWKKLNYNWGNK